MKLWEIYTNSCCDTCYLKIKIIFWNHIKLIISLIAIAIIIITTAVILSVYLPAHKIINIKANYKEIEEIKNVNKNDYLTKTFEDIFNLINNANDGDTIYLNGTYYGNGTSIKINKILNIIGDVNTILDANGSSCIFEIYSSNVLIDNIKLINGIGSSGGAINWIGNYGVLSNSIFDNNVVDTCGGAIYINGDNINIINSLFINNNVFGSNNELEGGGAIFSSGENLIIENCSFINNSAPNGFGGALKLANGSFIISSNKFVNNEALLGNNLFANNYESFYYNEFYLSYISDINASAFGDDILKLFVNNNFILNGKNISKDNYSPKNYFSDVQKNYFSDIINLINKANDGDTINLNGTYYGNGTSIKINKILNIIGDVNTTLDANGSSCIFEIYSSNVIIDNIKLINGIGSSGGAINWIGDYGVLSNSIFDNNVGNKYGGGIFWSSSNGQIINCTFKNNFIYSYGGAIYINGDNINIINSLFINNNVFGSNNELEGGGAIFSSGENLIIENCSFINNSAPKGFGGALKLSFGSWSINSNIFTNNSAYFGNNIDTENFDIFNGNIFYMNSISDISASALDDDIFKLFDNNIFNINGKIITKNDFCPKKSFSDIINLINNANNGDTINLHGCYYGNGNSIYIDKKITIIGDNITILNSNYSSRIFYVTSPNVIIKNIKFVNGSDGSGGAIYWTGDNGILSNCIFENNNNINYFSGYDGYGGAVFWWAKNGLIINCIFKNNWITRYGGAVYTNGEGTKTINCFFKNNSVINTYRQWEGGGAIYGDGQNEIIENCTFFNNSAPGSWGGALKLAAGSWNINYNKFINNSAALGNNIDTGNFDIFNGNIFYINSISDISFSAKDDDILKLFDKNNFILKGKIITNHDYFSSFQ